ncbi:MAG TPA: FtsX-like permease family protein [Blastocatellia bacterium]|nr:FtsX-like permease family protein [Blastocatellia bacterium]
MRPLTHKLVRDVWHLRGQVAAVMLVVACGVAAFVAMRSTYQSLLTSQAAYYANHRFADVFAQLKRAPETLAPRIAELPGVAAVQTRVVAGVTLDVPGLNEPARGRIISIPERQTPMLNDLHLLEGRYVELGKRDELIISGAFSLANNLHPGDTLSAIINGRWQKLKIVGVALTPEYVYEIRAGDMFPDSKRFGVMWMSRAALGPLFDMDGAFNDVALALAPNANESAVIEQLDSLLDTYGGLGAYNRAEQTSNHFISNEIAELRTNGTVIPSIFLAVTAFLLHLVLSRLVATQREQIAVLKAFGYSNITIGLHYLQLAFVAILGGVVLGIGVGWYFGYSITALYTDFFRFPLLRYEVGANIVATAIFISFVSSSLGAMMAVWRAVQLPPAEAMRPEPPARFRAGFLERLGVQRILSPATRIIVRNLARRPVKAFLTSLGISLSVALLVTGFYLYYDAIARVIEVQFYAVQRQDVTVTLNEPGTLRAQYDLANLPGVLQVEAFRTVPVRLRHAHRSRRIGIMGLERNAALMRPVDMNFQPIALPPDGVVLGAKLAEILAVQPGDTITVEVLEGQRPVREVQVVATLDDLMGLMAYMNLSALNQLLREGQTINGAYLKVDAQELPKLYAKLKEMPAVSGVGIPAAALATFNETLARTMGTSTGILIFFACVIAFGVVYNGARIALSERGRELASLRVLGFTQREIAVMLLGEQAILTLLAVPLGWALGYGLSWLITVAIDTELMRLPLVLSQQTYFRAFVIVLAAAMLSGLLVRWRLQRLNLIEVLKTRE